MWSAAIVEVEPGGERSLPLVGGAVDGAVRPSREQRADEAFGFAVGARPVGPRAQVFEPERLAGECVHDRAVAGAVVGENALDADAALAGVGDGATERRGGCGRLLVREHLD